MISNLTLQIFYMLAFSSMVAFVTGCLYPDSDFCVMSNKILFIIFWGYIQLALLCMGFKQKTNDNFWICLVGNVFFYILMRD